MPILKSYITKVSGISNLLYDLSIKILGKKSYISISKVSNFKITYCNNNMQILPVTKVSFTIHYHDMEET